MMSGLLKTKERRCARKKGKSVGGRQKIFCPGRPRGRRKGASQMKPREK
jgi:hypothetical protein